MLHMCLNDIIMLNHGTRVASGAFAADSQTHRRASSIARASLPVHPARSCWTLLHKIVRERRSSHTIKLLLLVEDWCTQEFGNRFRHVPPLRRSHGDSQRLQVATAVCNCQIEVSSNNWKLQLKRCAIPSTEARHWCSLINAKADIDVGGVDKIKCDSIHHGNKTP